MILSFSEFTTPTLLSESTKNTHLTHLEDVLLDDGPSGVTFALTVLREFGRILNGGTVSRSLNVSVKWDGAPAVIFGQDPSDGQFFVATKGAFNKTPKLAKSHADVDNYWSGSLAEVMHLAFDTLRAAKPKGVFQGDALYTRSTLKAQAIDGRTHLTFQPNTIMYAVDQDSDLGRRIMASKFGIVVHTMYTGTGTLANYSASPISPAAFASMKPGSEVVVLDAAFDDLSGTVTFTAQEQADFALALSEAESWARLDGRVFATILQEPLHAYLQQFINAQVRQNKSINPEQVVTEFQVYLAQLESKELAGKKSDAGQQKVKDKFGDVLTQVRNNRKGLINWFTLHNAVARAKNIVVRKLGQASKVASFVATPTGYAVTGPEGFVAVARNGKAIKLVDRLEFSRLNFTVPKQWA